MRLKWLFTVLGLELVLAFVLRIEDERRVTDSWAVAIVTVRASPEMPLQRVTTELFWNAAEAADALGHCRPPTSDCSTLSAKQDPFTGEPFPVIVPYILRERMFAVGRFAIPVQSRYSQRRIMVVVYWRASGPRQAKLVTLPDFRTSMRAVTIDLP